jgi:hypothetical protein
VREHKIDRSDWPAGPWDAEPDRWEGEIGGFPALAVRNDLGAWCGYIGLPADHLWLQADELPDDVERAVHGGFTYGPAACQELGPICHVPRPGQPDDVRWIGFDCAHYYDQTPSGRVATSGVYRDLQYVKDCIARLAELAANGPSRT